MPLRIGFCVDVLASMVITHYNECGALTDVEMCTGYFQPGKFVKISPWWI